MDRVVTKASTDAVLVGELTKVPSHKDHQQFTQKVCTSFEVPKACTWAKGVGNYYAQPLVHPSIGKYQFMPLRDARFGSQDIHLSQLHHTLAYARALQHWVEEAQPPVPSQPCHLGGSILDLWLVMDPLITFVEEDVFVTMVPSIWTEITLPQSMKAAQPEPPRSHSHISRACLRGSIFCDPQ